MKKTKQLVVLILTLGLLLSAAGLTGTAAGINIKTASPTQSAVTVNGSPVNFQAYNIDGANYFKLRDVAQAIKNTGKQFDVGYDSVKNAITVTTGKTYTAVGGELAASGETGRQTATLSTAKVILDGKSVQLTAFLIGGYNYFKLRDIGSALNFGVTWGAVANTISINTTIPYNTGAADIGFYDPGVDYNSKPRYKIVYMMADSSSLYDMFDQSFKMWADRMNCDYSSFSAAATPA